MKKAIWGLLLMLMTTFSTQAQERKWEHHLYGMAGVQLDNDEVLGGMIKASYGLNRYFTEHLSLMPGIAIRQEVENLFTSTDGSDSDMFVFLDFPVIGQYHINQNKKHWVLGVGPVFSFCVQNDTYYIDADPSSPLSNRKKGKAFGISLLPSAVYQTHHFHIGVEGQLGLVNMKKNYGLTTGTNYFHHLALVIGFHI